MKAKFAKLGTGVFIVLVLLLAACATTTVAPTAAPSSSAPTQPTAASPTPAPAQPTTAPAPTQANAAGGKTLVVGIDLPLTSLDPARSYEQALALRPFYETLVTYAGSDVGTFVPALATKWDVSPDGLKYTFTLRDGVKFHTGNTMTSKDVKWSWERAKNIKGNPSYLLDNVASVDTPDDKTVVVTLKNADPAFLAEQTFSIFSVLDSAALSAKGGTNAADAKDTDKAQTFLDQNSAGTGAFVLKGWNPQVDVTAEKFADYWGGASKIDKIILKNSPEAAPLLLALEAGDVDMAFNLSAEQAQGLKTNPDISVTSGTGTGEFFMFTNYDPAVGKGITDKPAVAAAIRKALDYDGIKQLAGPGATVPPTIVPLGLYAAWDENKLPKRDVEGAKQLLKDAGFPNGIDLTLDYPTKTDVIGVQYDLLAQKIQSDLADAGIRLTLHPVEFQAGLADYRAGKEPMGLWFWGADYLDVNDYIEFLPDRLVGKRAGWTPTTADPEVIALRDQALAESDPAKRLALWDKIQSYLITKGPFISVVEPSVNVAYRNNVKGFEYNPQWGMDPANMDKQ